MRVNTPVTQKEFPFPPGETLVSTTDLKGRITYCNPAFVHVSGFEHAELLGQPHNLIRHPDMPEEAFRDMWETIASGQPWSALVKNRRKDGDHYWVVANVTPLMERGQPVGYMSVRTEPSRAQIETAAELFGRMKQEAADGRLVHRLRSGQVELDTPVARLLRAVTPGPRGLWMGAAAAVTGAGVAAGWASAHLGGVAAAGVAGGCAALAATFGWAAWRQIEGGYLSLLGLANRMAGADLTATLESQRRGTAGRVERALNQTCVNVRSVVRDARTETERMRAGSREIAAGNQDLSARTESQASSLEQTASSMEQITGTVRQSAASAQRASELASQARQVTRSSSEAVDAVTRSMQDIHDASSRIGEIIQTIDGIAFQTNILALNAAVEAARAGEQGKGFAVVASEVRSLAQRSSAAAREIKVLIQNSSEKVEAGTRETSAAQSSMASAVQTVDQVGTLIDEITSGAREQLTGISQINEAVAQMDTITQQNAAMVEQLASSASNLQQQADTVAEAVRVFRLEAGAATPVQDAVALRKAARQAASQHQS